MKIKVQKEGDKKFCWGKLREAEARFVPLCEGAPVLHAARL